jgi:peptidyl-prolyl cis-trans isomerase B (cyclophilin B)
MKSFYKLSLVLILQLIFAAAGHTQEKTMIKMTTNFGVIEIELFTEQAPNTTENFIQYVNDGFFDGLIFHRVIPSFMIQGGGFEPGMRQKSPNAPIQNEADNGLKNERGTLSMARTNDPHSATSQFFISVKDNAFLDFKSKDASGWGYAVFAKVVSGMDVVDSIAQTPTGKSGGHGDVPLEDVVIEKAEVVQ